MDFITLSLLDFNYEQALLIPVFFNRLSEIQWAGFILLCCGCTTAQLNSKYISPFDFITAIDMGFIDLFI